MTIKLQTPLISAIGLALVVLTTGVAESQSARNDQAPPKPGMGGTMMAERQKMMADMKARQKTLDDLVAAMNLATGSEKVDRLAAVVTELVSQHREMSTRMMSGGMMMQMPATQPAPSATAPAPAATPEDEHAAHHPKP